MTELPVTMEPDGWMEKTGGYAKDMTLRQYIAIQAMTALSASKSFIDLYSGGAKSVAMQSCLLADAMLKELND